MHYGKDRFKVNLNESNIHKYKSLMDKYNVYLIDPYWNFDDELSITTNIFNEDKILISDYFLQILLHDFTGKEKFKFKENVFHSIGDSNRIGQSNEDIKDIIYKSLIFRVDELTSLYNNFPIEFRENCLNDRIRKSSRKNFPLRDIIDFIKDDNIIPMNEELINENSMFIDNCNYGHITYRNLRHCYEDFMENMIMSGLIFDRERKNIFLLSSDDIITIEDHKGMDALLKEIEYETRQGLRK